MAQLSTYRANTGLNDRQTYKQIDGHWTILSRKFTRNLHLISMS